MESLISQVFIEVALLLREGKINETQAMMIKTLVKSTESFEVMMKLYPDLSVRKRILKIVKEISLKIKIPGGSLPEEISSPLDCFLHSKKREIVAKPRVEFHLSQMSEALIRESSELCN